MRWIAAAVLSAGCLQASTTHCAATGAECPAGYSCVATPPYCAPNGEVDPCAGKGDQAACTSPSVSNGVCIGGLCTACTADLEGCSVAGWQPMTSGTTEDLHGVWDAGVGHAYAVGANGTVLEYDGVSWTTIATPTADAFVSTWGRASDDLLALTDSEAYHFTGSWAPTNLGSAGGMLDLWGVGGSSLEAFAVGSSNQIWHYDGSQWRAMTESFTSTFARFSGVWGTGPTDVTVVGKDGATPVMLHYDGGTSWMKAPALAPPYDSLSPNGVWGASSADIFVVGTAGTNGVVVYFGGAAWTPTTVAASGLDCVWGLDRQNAYAAGPTASGDIILHFDGTSWTPEPGFPTGVPRLNAIAGDTFDVFAVGNNGTILRHTAH